MIELSSLRCLNEKKPGSIKTVILNEDQKPKIKPSQNLCLSFENDPELVVIVYFKEEVKLRAINFITSDPLKPNFLGVYLNEENVSFDITQEEPQFSFPCNHYTLNGEIELYPNPVKASNLRNIVLHFRGN